MTIIERMRALHQSVKDEIDRGDRQGARVIYALPDADKIRISRGNDGDTEA